jgi:hypothetical protein
MAVIEILLRDFGIISQVGKKTKCPFCGHKTFSIKKDDTIGKCFHPLCGRYLLSSRPNNSIGYEADKLLTDLQYDSHKYLIDNQDDSARTAYRYLVDERRIDPRVIADSMLGVVPPGYLIRKDASFSNKKKEDENILYGLEDFLEKCAGWLCFFYTDANHRIVSVKFRKPYSKDFAYFKPFESAGLFGHSLFSPYSKDLSDFVDLPLIVTEGEFNQLQLQTLCLRHSRAMAKKEGYVNACAVGGVLNADYETISKISRCPVICYDNDSNGAGFELVKRAQDHMTVQAFTTPEADSDLDEFIRSFGDDYKAAWEALKDLIGSRKYYFRNYDTLAEQIKEARQYQGKGDKRRPFEINDEVSQIIINDLNDRGQFYYDGFSGYFFYKGDKKLIPIEPENTDFNVMLSNYGINRSESIYRYLSESLHVSAIKNGKYTQVYRLSHYNPETFTLYLFNNNNQIHKISPDATELVDNGSDGVLFLSDTKNKPFTVSQPVDSDSPLEEAIISKINFEEDILTADERRLIFTLWFYSLFFIDIMPTRPILAFVGEKGSGKSITARKIGMLLFGDRFDVTPLSKDPKDFDAAITNSPYVALDNADSRSDWLNDRLACVATGGTIKKRELYTTNRLIEIPIRCNLAITSRNPCFRRDDVADRLLIMKVGRFTNWISEKSLLQEVINGRNELISEVTEHLREAVTALKQSHGRNDGSSFRMADFADFAIKIARYAGIENKVHEIFGKLTYEQSAFTLESDPVFDLLNLWIEKPGNSGREITNADLCFELCALAEEKGMEFPYRGKIRSFAQRMANLRANLIQFYDIGQRTGRGRTKYYSFTPKLQKRGAESK